MSQRSALRQFQSRLSERISTLLGGPESQGYQAVPSSYGATNGAPNNGLQTLGADPTKIEPKVWLASERTFLNWLRVALLLSSFALALFNSASTHDHVAKWMGFSYAVIAVGMIGYAWIMQNRRRHRIVTRYGGHHDEIYGPVVVVGLIFLAVLVNFILRVKQRETLRHHPTPKNPWIMSVDLIKSAFVISPSA
ncbi:hypothetical protein BCR35DRAFT_278003 [Leucosporidium creatinivorum]|uniref:DUF202 domain-containing protein n=1 Tax=Leucosporidium creatinivorum TaxID=106004 RepID=A0A1Y2FKZ7_9BASI|nr:hypothetical protein BCR35DRAFT_278003 [Leucosporidium creatinivorum]